MADDPRYSIQDLADLADVSRRTVRYYVQEGLIPAPLGVGRGPHYAQAHLQRLLQVKELQSSGCTLDEIRATVDGGTERRATQNTVAGATRNTVARATKQAVALPDRSVWRRLQVAPGIEIHVENHITLPGPNRLRELADWCRLHFTPSSSE